MADHNLRTESDRSRLMGYIAGLDLSKPRKVAITEVARSDATNRRMWAMLRDISRQVEWYGRKMDEESWKHVFSAAVQQQDAVPGINGGFVVLGISTRKQSKQWFSDMFEVMEAFASERGVKFTTADHWGFG